MEFQKRGQVDGMGDIGLWNFRSGGRVGVGCLILNILSLVLTCGLGRVCKLLEVLSLVLICGLGRVCELLNMLSLVLNYGPRCVCDHRTC